MFDRTPFLPLPGVGSQPLRKDVEMVVLDERLWSIIDEEVWDF